MRCSGWAGTDRQAVQTLGNVGHHAGHVILCDMVQHSTDLTDDTVDAEPR